MFLQHLYALAERRRREGDPAFTDPAFVRKPIRWIIQVDSEGRMSTPGPLDTMGENKRAMEYDKPQTGETKNSGGRAEFLADTITGVFGLDTEPEKYSQQENARKRRNANNEVKYEDFWQQMQQAYNSTQHNSLRALLSFHTLIGSNPPFLRWGTSKESKASEKPTWWMKTATGHETRLGSGDYLTFEVNGELLLLDDEVIRPYWRKMYEDLHADKDTSAQLGTCLVTGEDNIPIARTHEVKIRGVRNTGSGGAIVSFDKPAFRSYGFDKSLNAPVSTRASKDYCNALTWLLSRRNHSLTVGDMSICFWTRDMEETSNHFAQMLEQPDPKSVRDFLHTPWTGVEQRLWKHDQFHSVALSGNSGRIVVRHWIQIPIETALENLRGWFEDLNITSYGDTHSGNETIPPLGFFRLACTSVRDKDDLQPDVLTQLYRAALERTTPPVLLLKSILYRLQSDLSKFGQGILETPLSRKTLRAISDARQPVPPAGESRFALIKLILNRNEGNRKEGTPMIEPQVFETDDAAYNCGRLLAVLAEAQQKAHDYKLEGAGVVERYFGTACAAPASVFPLLIRLNRHHLKAISKSEKYKGHERFLEAAIQNILVLFRPGVGKRPPVFPRVLDLQAQGRFALGFYQQQAADDAARHSPRSNSNQQQSHS